MIESSQLYANVGEEAGQLFVFCVFSSANSPIQNTQYSDSLILILNSDSLLVSSSLVSYNIVHRCGLWLRFPC